MKKPVFSPDYSYRYFMEAAKRAKVPPMEFADAVDILRNSVSTWRDGKCGMSAAAKDRIDAYFVKRIRPETVLLMQRWDKSFKGLFL